MTFFIYKNPDTSKKQDNLSYVFLYKNPYTLRYTIFQGVFEIGGGGGGAFLLAKKIHFALIFIFETMHFPFRSSIQKVRHFASYFYMQKKSTLRYVFISKIYCIVYSDIQL